MQSKKQKVGEKDRMVEGDLLFLWNDQGRPVGKGHWNRFNGGYRMTLAGFLLQRTSLTEGHS